MGGTSWSYWVEYQSDIQKALDELRREVFEQLPQKEKDFAYSLTAEDYLKKLASETGLFVFTAEEAANLQSNLSSESDESDKETLEELRAEYATEIETFELASVETRLASYYGFDGTHTIIDVDQVEGYPQKLAYCLGIIRPLEPAQYLQFFGTKKPSQESIEKANRDNDLTYLCRKFQGIYVIAYTDETPTKIYFTGMSGD